MDREIFKCCKSEFFSPREIILLYFVLLVIVCNKWKKKEKRHHFPKKKNSKKIFLPSRKEKCTLGNERLGIESDQWRKLMAN